MTNTHQRDAILACLGRFPERVAAECTVMVHVDAGDHTRTLLEYSVRPGERVTAWLLRPNEPSAVPRAGILALHQHNGQYELGKSEPAGLAGNPEQHYGLELCQRGYVVLCPDHLCFEDRRPDAAQRAANPMIDGPGYERFAFTQRIAEGSCLQTTYIHDMTVALDVLAGLSDVNPERLGAIGHSLGGQEALWLSWYDPRVRAAVSSCGFGQLRTIIRDQINHNLAMYVPGLLALGDLELIIAGVAPRAFMLSAGTEDWIFPIDGVRALAASGRDAYTSAGVAERFDAQIFAGEHRFAADMRERAYAFLDRWLVGART